MIPQATAPDITALVLLYLIAAWMVVTGVLEVAAAIVLRRKLRGEWLLALGGIVSVTLPCWPSVPGFASPAPHRRTPWAP